MPRYYVENKKGKWNIYSTIVDDLLFDKFVDFKEMKEFILNEEREEREKELDTLLNEQTMLNTMLYEDCIENLKIYGKKIPKD